MTPPRSLEVCRVVQLTPHMRRITLTGDDLAGFPVESSGAHIKLFLPRPGQDRPVLPRLSPNGPVWPPKDIAPITRTYTVRRYDPVARKLDIDFVLHGDSGPASKWAGQAQPGDRVGIAGPGGPRLYVPDAECYLLAGDMTALPAIAAVLEALPASARGRAFIEIPDAGEEQRLSFEAGIELTWVHRDGAAIGGNGLLETAVRGIPWPEGRLSATIAGESAAVLALRDYLRRDRGLDRDALYAVPYWKASLSEEGYHAERHRVMDERD